MKTHVRNRLVALGALWGLALVAVPVLVMTEPYRLTGFLFAAHLCAALGGVVGTLLAGRRAAKRAASGAGHPGVAAWFRTGASQGLVGGGMAALLLWALMALATSGFSLQNPVDVSVLLRPQAVFGSFFISLSTFLYAFFAGLLLGPVFGPLVDRTVRRGAGGEEDLVVR